MSHVRTQGGQPRSGLAPTRQPPSSSLPLHQQQHRAHYDPFSSTTRPHPAATNPSSERLLASRPPVDGKPTAFGASKFSTTGALRQQQLISSRAPPGSRSTAGAGAPQVNGETNMQHAYSGDADIQAQLHYQQQMLTEHFGFSPLSFVDDVINSVNNMIYQASMALQEFVEGQMEELVVTDRLKVRDFDIKVDTGKSMHKFETLLEASVDKNFDRFELYALKNIFGVPEDVDIVLPHYEALDFGISVEREEQLNEQLELLRRQLIATKALNFKLRKQLEIEENRRRQLEKCREQIRFLKDVANEYPDVTPVPQTLIFVRDNIETLHRRFESLHERLSQNTTRANSYSSNGSSSTVAAAGSAPPSTASIASTPSTPSPYPPPETVTQVLADTLASMEPDKRMIYIRSVVRRQVQEHLASDPFMSAAVGSSGGSSGAGTNIQFHELLTP